MEGEKATGAIIESIDSVSAQNQQMEKPVTENPSKRIRKLTLELGRERPAHHSAGQRVT